MICKLSQIFYAPCSSVTTFIFEPKEFIKSEANVRVFLLPPTYNVRTGDLSVGMRI